MTITRLSLATVLLTLAGCDCGTKTRKLFPKIEVLDELGNTRTTVEFGKVQLNFTATKKVRIRNAGTASLSLEKAVFTNPLFALGEPMPISIAVNGEYELPLAFTPNVADQRELGTVTVATDDPEKPTVQLNLLGTGVTATAVVQPTMLDFGEVYVGEMKELSFSLTNSGSNELPVTSATLTGVDPNVTSNLMPLVKTPLSTAFLMLPSRKSKRPTEKVWPIANSSADSGSAKPFTLYPMSARSSAVVVSRSRSSSKTRTSTCLSLFVIA